MHAATGAGQIVAGRYRLLGQLGRGATGTVWRASDPLLGREVAIKEVRLPWTMSEQERTVLRERTFREARAVAKLHHHPGVVSVHDVVEDGGNPWIVMELVPGRSLARVLAEDGPLAPRQAAAMALILVDALAAAHAAGIIHRDVKPANVLLTDSGRAVLTDFGIATLDGEEGLTQAGMVMGTPGFCAPERIRGDPAGPASDLWSLGATLYAAVEGHGLFQGRDSPMAMLASIVNADPPPPRLAGALAPVIMALLSRHPAERPDAAAVRQLLTGVAGRSSGTASQSPATAGQDPAIAGRGSATGNARPPAGPQSPESAGTLAMHQPGTPGGQGPLPRQAGHHPQQAGHPARRPGAPSWAPGPARTLGPGTAAFPAGTSRPGSPAHPDRATASGHPQPGGSHPSGGLPSGSHLSGGLPRGGHPRGGPPGGGQPRGYQPGGGPPGGGQQAAQPGPPHRYPGTAAGHPGDGSAPAPSRPGRIPLIVLAALAIVCAGLIIGWLSAHRARLAGSPGPAGASPAGRSSAATLPLGFHWYQGTAGSAASFTLAVPDGWQAATRGGVTTVRDPAIGDVITVKLGPASAASPLAVAAALERYAVSSRAFPGYRRIALMPTRIRGGIAALWWFTSQRPGGGRAESLDIVAHVAAQGAGGDYILGVTAPLARWPGARAALTEALRTFSAQG